MLFLVLDIYMVWRSTDRIIAYAGGGVYVQTGYFWNRNTHHQLSWVWRLLMFS